MGIESIKADFVPASWQMGNVMASFANLENAKREREYLQLRLAEKQVRSAKKQEKNQEKIIELLESIKENSGTETDKILLARLGAVYGVCNAFINDYPILKKHGFIEVDSENHRLKTQYGKGFIFDYFKSLSPDENIYWKPMEELFGFKAMRSALGGRVMLTEGMDKWIEINGLDKETIENNVIDKRKERI
ncbi:MAG: hypothetical protein FWB73_00955 [Treponema sp.]|nr:hypothetical protein [Treponema sp.]